MQGRPPQETFDGTDGAGFDAGMLGGMEGFPHLQLADNWASDFVDQQQAHGLWQPLGGMPGEQSGAPDSWPAGSGGSGFGGFGGGGAAAAPGGAGSGGDGQLDPQTMAAKLATAREKNRLAQQRFRQRQRAKQAEAGQQCAVLQQEVDELEGENARLHRQNRIYERVLAVRDAMLQAFTSLHPTASEQLEQQQQQQQQQQAAQQQQMQQLHLHQQRTAAAAAATPASSAAQGLVKALHELPSEREMDAAAAPAAAADAGAGAASQQQQKAQQAQQTQQPLVIQPDQPVPQSLLAEQHRSGSAAQLDGSALQKVENIPPAHDMAIRAMVAAMQEPEELLDYFRQWQAELSVSYLAAESAGFDAASVHEVEVVQDRMAEVWWHVSHLKPAYVCYLAHAALPEASGQSPLWREIAEVVLPQLDETSRAILRRAWFNYSKRLAKIAAGVSKWVQRLQQYSVQATGAMATNASQALQLAEITSHMAAAVQNEYTASMEFVADQMPATTALIKAYINHASAPFQPDIVAIVYQMLCLDSEERQARAKASEGASASATGSAAGPSLALAAPSASSAAAPGQG